VAGQDGVGDRPSAWMVVIDLRVETIEFVCCYIIWISVEVYLLVTRVSCLLCMIVLFVNFYRLIIIPILSIWKQISRMMMASPFLVLPGEIDMSAEIVVPITKLSKILTYSRLPSSSVISCMTIPSIDKRF
jgi:hypothetical protein